MEMNILDNKALNDLLMEVCNEYLKRQKIKKLSGSGNGYNFEFIVKKIGE